MKRRHELFAASRGRTVKAMELRPLRVGLGRVVVPLVALVTACGWIDTDKGGGDPGIETDFFSNACIGTLTQQVALQEPTGPEAWSNIEATGQPGQQVLVAAPSTQWYGYLFVDGEVTARVGTAPFELGVHFDSDCAGNPKEEEPLTRKVVLQDANFYETEELSGEHCTIEAGTVLSGGYFAGPVGPGVRQVTSQAVEELCGIPTMFTPDLVTGELIRLPYPRPD